MPNLFIELKATMPEGIESLYINPKAISCIFKSRSCTRVSMIGGNYVFDTEEDVEILKKRIEVFKNNA